MAFKALFLAHAPDADHEIHQSIIKTGRYELFTVVVKNQCEAINACERIYAREKIDAVMLCPGFTHTDVAEIFLTLEGKVSVNACRGDGPSNQIAHPAIQREYFG